MRKLHAILSTACYRACLSNGVQFFTGKRFFPQVSGKRTCNGEYSSSGGDLHADSRMADAGYTAVFPAAEYGFLPKALVGGRRTEVLAAGKGR